MTPTIKTAVAGVSGYAGMELARLLLRHPHLRDAPVFLGRPGEDAHALLSELHPQLGNNDGARTLKMESFRWEDLVARGIDLLYLAIPHEQSREWVPLALAKGIRVIDLSGAWRLQDAVNREIYKFSDVDTAVATSVQQQAVYGMPELHRDELHDAIVVANPGCYATSIILALAPLVRAGFINLDRGIVCDAKSGVSGAGKTPSATTHFMNAADNLSAYAPFNHRHTGELLEQLNLTAEQLTFTPHLLPIPRGILSTIYFDMNAQRTSDEIDQCYQEFYAASPMVRWYGRRLPQIQYVAHTNFCDIGFELAPDSRRVVLVSCLDNLLKGAASQAVQNMNLMYGWEESEGLL
jgi:N-acetyl-gamma-glutamyl-phosphate reductase